MLGHGASGAIHDFEDEINLMKIGDYSLKNIPAEFVEENANTIDTIVSNGTFGLSLMKRFNITFDYFNSFF